MKPSKNKRQFAILLSCFLLFFAAAGWGAVAGSISGAVKDPAGSVVPNANVTVQEVNTGLAYRTLTDGRGYYTLPVLPVGHYELDVQAPGFRGYQRKDIVLDTNAALTLDASLEVGSATRDGERERQCAACGDHRDAAGSGDHRPADDGCSTQWPQLY